MGVAPKGDGQAEGDRKDDALDHGAGAHGGNNVVAKEAQERVLEGDDRGLTLEYRALDQGGLAQAGARLENQRETEGDARCDERRGGKDADALEAHAGKRLRGQAAHGDDDGAHDERHDAHLDEAEEDVADELDLGHRGAAHDAGDNTDNHGEHDEIRDVDFLFLSLSHANPFQITC